MNKITQFSLLLLLIFGCSEKQNYQAVEPLCLPSQSQCFFETKVGKVQVLFDQHKLVAESPFNLIVEVEGNPNVTVTGFMEGQSMYMGKIPLFFEKKEGGRIVANSIFGSCGEPNMVWRVNLNIVDQSQESQAFTFTVNSNLN